MQPKLQLAAIASVAFLILAPGTVAGFLPWFISGWHGSSNELSRWIAIPGLLLGALVLLDAVRRFVVEGCGTPAPVYPTQHLVVRGLYTYVRNPMYLAVLTLIFSQALLLSSLPLTGYGFAVWFIFRSFVIFYEEPALQARYGAEYAEYKSKVGRWL
jgi:protein-S-isoprenylcysteine O-methyltransferase Ste14